MKKILVGIVMGSDSDLIVMSEAAKVLEEFGVMFELLIVSAHRTPEKMMEYAKSAHKRGLKVIIAGAGGAAHLPGMIASLTPLPVIGVPVKSKSLEGMDSLLSIVQMPPGVPVATVAINGSKNAAILTVQILAINDVSLCKKVGDYKMNLEKVVEKKSNILLKVGYKKYLSNLKKI